MKRSLNIKRLVTRFTLCLLCPLGLSLFVSPVAGQIFESGPSDSSLFEEVISVPPDPNITFSQIIGGDGLTTQVNIFEDGSISTNVDVFNSEVNFSGGSTRGGFEANQSEVNISGGSVGIGFVANESEINLSGGSIGTLFQANAGTVVNVSGGILGLGTSGNSSANTGSVVNISGGSVQGTVEAFSGSEVNISGGSSFLAADTGSLVNVSGGSTSVSARSGSEVNISGGASVRVSALSGSMVTITGGNLASRFFAAADSNVELIGGEFQLNGEPFSEPVISTVEGDTFTGTLSDGTTFALVNAGPPSGQNDFRSDRLTGVQLTLGAIADVDLTPIVVPNSDQDVPSGLRPGQTLTLLNGGQLEENFQVVSATLNVEGGTVGNFAGATNGTVNISGGGVGEGFEANQSEVNISGGSVNEGFVANDSEINISGGSFNAFGGTALEANSGTVVNISDTAILTNFQANSGSVVNMSGGTVSFAPEVNSGSEVNVSGGSFGFGFINDGGDVNISGGLFGSFFLAIAGEVNISGGTIDQGFSTGADSTVNLFGSNFVLDGVALDGNLTAGEAFPILDRDVTLTGLLADGTAFSFDLNSGDALFPNDAFDADGTLTVTLGAPVTTATLGDVNQDGVIDFSDIPAFIAVLQSGEFQAEADIDQNGVVDFSDIPLFIEILAGT